MLKVVQGGFKEGVWLRDRNFYSDKDIAEGNEWFKQLSERDPQHFSWLVDYIWDIKPQTQPTRVK